MEEEIESILNRVEQSKTIYTLNLSNRHLKIMPSRIGSLVHLKSLFLDNNQLIFVPEIGSLIQLEELSLENNQLTLLPESCSNLTHLKMLNLSKNSIKCMNGSILTTFEQLTFLWLNECGLMYLPKEIGNLINLQMLGLKSNRLENIPDEFAKLVKLKWLNLENNLLSDLKFDAFKNLLELSHLNVNKNKLEHIPESLFYLKTCLNVVLMRSNLIKNLKDSDIVELSHLSKIDLRDNPFIAIVKKRNGKFSNELHSLNNFIIEDD